ncbi:MAG: OsmC family protein [Syntrophobacteraceae bacterium]|nr:OsmC family protein [Syntrophobacteraceae bacterium]
MRGNEDKKQEKLAPINISTTITAGPNRRMIARARDHQIVLDVRKERGGEDAGPTPPECLAMALGGCIVNMCRVLAMQKGIVLEDLRVTVSGEIDPSKAFGICADARAGFSHLSARVETGSRLSEAEMAEFSRELRDRCPLCDTINSPTPLEVIFPK